MKITHLNHGKHKRPTHGMCLLEAASFLAGEPFSDHPRCVSTTIAAFGRRWNDDLNDADRDRLLLPLLPEILNTAPTDERLLGFECLDWFLRTFVPAWLELCDETKEFADKLRAMPKVTDENAAEFAEINRAAEVAAKSAARSAVWDAVRSAAGVAAWRTARGADESAAGVAARGAAEVAAWSAAWSAATDAATAAVQAGGRDALQPVVERLQASAVELLRRLCKIAKENKQ